jgi:hypothetical protein
MKTIINLFVFCILAGMMAFPVYAFASSNSGSQIAGEGTSTISGWTISNVKYELTENPSFVGSVSFDLDGAADNASVKVSSSHLEYTKCSNIYEYHWQCDFQACVSISSMDEFHVVATGN